MADVEPKPQTPPPASVEAENEAPPQQEEESQQPDAPFTPRSILRRSSVAEGQGGDNDDDAANKRSASAAKRRATISKDVSYMPDVFFDPTVREDPLAVLPAHERLHIDASRKAAELEALRTHYLAKEEALNVKQCTFDPKTTRKTGKGGKERAKDPPYRNFSEFLDLQSKWLSDMPKRLAKLEQQHKDIEDGKRDAKGEMSKTTKALVTKMKREERYDGPMRGWEQRFNDFVVRKSGDAVIAEMMSSGVSPSHEQDITASRKRNGTLEGSIYSFSPVISAYAAAKADRERGGGGAEGNTSPLRQTWEQDPVGYASRSDVPFRATRASDSVFEKLYKESSVRSAANRILAESFIENEVSTLFKPKTNENNAWQFSTSRARTAGSRADGDMAIVSQTDDFVEYANGSYSFNGEHYAEDGTHIGPAPPLPPNNDTTFGIGSSISVASSYNGPRHPDEVVDTLLQRGEEYKERRERRRQLLEQRQEQFTFKPETNKRSHKILADYAKRAEEELTNELARQTMAQLNEGAPVDSPDTLPEGVTGIPKPKKAAKFNLEQFTMRHERAAALRNAKLQQVAEQRDYEQLGECTFRPALSVKSLRGFSPVGVRRQQGIYSPGSFASAYSASTAPSMAPSARSRTPNTSSVSPASPLDSRHRYVSKAQHAQGPVLNSTVNSYRSGANSSLPSGRSSAVPRNPNGGGGGAPYHHQQQQHGNASYHNNSYEIPLAQVPPTQRGESGMRRPSMVSTTDSQLHDHHDEEDDALLGGGGEAEVDQYLDDIESEMKDVLADWRSAARGTKA